MAAKTVASVRRYSMGDKTLLAARFSDIDNDDTYVSGLDSIQEYWAVRTDDPTAGTEGIGLSESSGTITFYTGEDNCTATLYMMVNA